MCFFIFTLALYWQMSITHSQSPAGCRQKHKDTLFKVIWNEQKQEILIFEKLETVSYCMKCLSRYLQIDVCEGLRTLLRWHCRLIACVDLTLSWMQLCPMTALSHVRLSDERLKHRIEAATATNSSVCTASEMQRSRKQTLAWYNAESASVFSTSCGIRVGWLCTCVLCVWFS